MNRFTPGPWTAAPENKPWAVLDSAGQIIGTFKENNTSLISSAPDMYEVVEMIEKILEEDKFRLEEYGFNLSGDRALALELAKAALAKAEGKEVSNDE